MRFFLLVLCALAAFADPPSAGVSEALAQSRAKTVSDVRYRLSVKLTEHASAMAGHEVVEFRFTGSGDVVLDFREGKVSGLRVNGAAASGALVNGHLVLPAAMLRAGANQAAPNQVELDFEAPVAQANRAITRILDPVDSTEYVYTLFVPMDASMAFPCFDQPDLKARFTFEANVPQGWTVISNTREEAVSPGVFRFPETRSISTYLFAFAAGPFEQLTDTGAPVPMRLFVRKSMLARAKEEWPEIAAYTKTAMGKMSAFFDQPFPFPKYDQVLLPGFPYGGMEHAGATFLREDAMLFRAAPNKTDHQRRSVTVLHELAHQWFGDLVTMRWFDDLWLKEGFAQYMAFHTLAEMEDPSEVWKRFYESIKPVAYNIDETQGTAPIYQRVRNLADAKSAYGPIVYQKAPSLLQVMNYKIGEEAFRGGVRVFLKEHAYANATWQDLIGAFSGASKQDLNVWANAWVKQRGMPVVTVEWACSGGKVSGFEIAQRDSLKEGHLWPVSSQVRLGDATLPVAFSSVKTEVPAALGKPCPAYVFANSGDHGYGKFLPDERSLAGMRKGLTEVTNPLERALYWGALWDSVRETELSPREYVDLAVKSLPGEPDLDITQSVLGRTGAALRLYMSGNGQADAAARFEALLMDRMKNAENRDFRIAYFRAFTGAASTAAGLAEVRNLLGGTSAIPGVPLQQRDRWNLVSMLVRQGEQRAAALVREESEKDRSDDGKRSAYAALAGVATSENKEKYFGDYLKDGAVQEDFVTASLGSFNAWNQEPLTLVFVSRALDALPQVKRQRKIFFVNGWLSSFVTSHTAPEARRAVEEFLLRKDLDPDLRLKVLEVKDDLDRTIRIRARWRE
jgi:aminopeptidase N